MPLAPPQENSALREGGRCNRLHEVLMSEVLSILALLVSLATFVYVARTYAVQYRPYVGIVGIEHELTGNPPTMLRWRCVVKNVGSIPAWVHLEEYQATFTADGVATSRPIMEKNFGHVMFLMPEHPFNITGMIEDAEGHPVVRDLLDGRATLDVSVRLGYESRGIFWLKNKYTYEARSRYAVAGTKPGFFMVFAEAN